MTLLFSGRHFPSDIILLSVRYYLAYKLSYREIEEILAERHIQVDHSTLKDEIRCEVLPFEFGVDHGGRLDRKLYLSLYLYPVFATSPPEDMPTDDVFNRKMIQIPA